MAGTLADMKARIALEIRRTNLATEIAEAIETAIEEYQQERFFFSEQIFDFNTVAGQEFYSSSDSANIGNIIKLDYVKLFVGGTLPYTLKPLTPERIEFLNANGANQGQPLCFCDYTMRLRFWPIPNDIFDIRIGAHMVIAAPATDAETNNPWMTYAERLIRSRAKWELALHRLADDALAQRMQAAVDTAKLTLIQRTTKRDQQGDHMIIPTDF